MQQSNPEVSPEERQATNQVLSFQDITVSRLSCANYDEDLQKRETELMPLRNFRSNDEGNEV